MSGLRAGLVAVTSLGMVGLPLVAATQVPPPTSRGDSLIIGAASLYEVRYGTPQSRDLDEEPPRDWPRQHSTRTAGRLYDLRWGGGPTARRLEWVSSLSTHAVCGRLYCLAITPAEEMASVFATDARLWVGRRVEIVGAIDDLNKDPRAEPLWAFLSWSITLQDEGGAGDDAPPITSELEALVWSPEALAGERISVKGTFRGANLFDEMPPGSQRKAGDWVLKDGPFFIWVTGRPPRGSGFSLDPSSRSDCRWRLEVSGTVESEGGLVYLKAKDVRLLGLAPEASLDR